jgi:hypothetical protein
MRARNRDRIQLPVARNNFVPRNLFTHTRFKKAGIQYSVKDDASIKMVILLTCRMKCNAM